MQAWFKGESIYDATNEQASVFLTLFKAQCVLREFFTVTHHPVVKSRKLHPLHVL